MSRGQDNARATEKEYDWPRDASALHTFLTCCRRFQHLVPGEEGVQDAKSCLRLAATLRDAVLIIGRDSALSQSDAYVIDSIVCKILFAETTVNNASVDWSQVLASDLGLLCPAESMFLDQLPRSWTAAEASTFFLGRPDWPLLLSVFVGRWKAASVAVKTPPGTIVSVVGAERFAAAIAAEEELTGASATPAAALQRALSV